MKKSNRGGKRLNAGVKPKNKLKRVTLSCRIDVSTQATIEAIMKDKSCGKGEAVDYLVKDIVS